MTTDYIEEVLRAIDPAVSDITNVTQSHQDEIWQTIVASLADVAPSHRRRARRIRRSWSIGALGASIGLAATLLVTLGSTPISAVAATLKSAAAADSGAAVLPTLSAGQFYYQQSQVSLVCQFGGTNMAPGESLLTYVANGTMQSWTADGSGKVVITPAAIGADGSHFATPADEARWIALGKPFIPCALYDSSNRLDGNPANANHQSVYGGYAATVSGYNTFGVSLASATQTSLLSATTSINNLPQSAAAISTLLANGQIGTDGTVSASPQTCPIVVGSSGGATGCTASEQLSILEQFLQLPDTSAKLGSVLYQVLENLPGAKLVGPVTTADGVTGTAVRVPSSANATFQVVLDPTSGALLSCSELLTANGVTSSVGSISYGPVQVVQGQSAAPSITNNS